MPTTRSALALLLFFTSLAAAQVRRLEYLCMMQVMQVMQGVGWKGPMSDCGCHRRFLKGGRLLSFLSFFLLFHSSPLSSVTSLFFLDAMPKHIRFAIEENTCRYFW
jgi:hypothetical protein